MRGGRPLLYGINQNLAYQEGWCVSQVLYRSGSFTANGRGMRMR